MSCTDCNLNNLYSQNALLLAIILLFLCTYSNPTRAAAHDDVRIAGAAQYDLTPAAYTLRDPESKLSFEEISSKKMQSAFQSPNPNGINFGLTNDSVWVRVKLWHIDKKHQYPEQKQWLIDLRRALLDEVDLYIVRNGREVEHLQSDLRMQFSERPIRNVNSVFPLLTERGEKITLYFRIKSRSAIYVPIYLQTPAEFIRMNVRENFLAGLLFGALIIMILHNVFLLLSTRNISYFFYIGYLAPITLFEFIEIGHGIIIFDSMPKLLDKSNSPTLIWLALLGALSFTSRFLDLRTDFKNIRIVYVALYCFVGLCIIVNFYIPYDSALVNTSYLVSIGSMINVVVPLYVWYRRKDFNAALLASSFLICNVGYIIYGSLANGLLPATQWAPYLLTFSTLLQATLLAFAMGERIKQAQSLTLISKQSSLAQLKEFRNFFENSTEGIYELSLTGELTSANSSTARILGLNSVSELLKNSRSATKILFPGNGKIRSALTSFRNPHHELTISGSDGSMRHVLHTTRLIHAPNGEPSHIEGTLIDISDRILNMDAQRDRIRERHEKEQARLLTAGKTIFLKDMSFRIRSSLTGVMGFSETLRGNTLDRKTRQLVVRSVIHNAQSLLQLINDILDRAKIEAGKMTFEKIRIDLEPFLQEIFSLCWPRAAEGGIRFEIACELPLPAHIVGDPLRIRQALSYLCLNAIHSTTFDQIAFHLQWDHGSQRLTFQIFEPNNPQTFSAQSESSTAGQLDINIALHLLKLQGGHFLLEKSTEGSQRFSGSLHARTAGDNDWLREIHFVPSPQANQPNEACEPKPNTQQKSASFTAASKEPPKLLGEVLLAEDNSVNQKLISGLVAKTGATITVVDNGKLALEQALSKTYDLILMDINMPLMDGISATREIRAANNQTPIYALTAADGEQELKDAISAGCCGYLSKPVDLPVFYATMSRHLKRDAYSDHKDPPQII
ncbi:Hypothetical protein HDN1F_20660 [gamma proteobacterium HdN1]|nr:Hypothetical protein HDN1F_20660 [gamma proteobacterium HdN1]